MPLRFVFGRAGSGKTRHCADAILDACRDDPLGPPLWWIVPRQMTLQAQRMLVERDDVPGVCRVTVTSLDQLAESLLTQSSGRASVRLDATGRQIVLAYLLRKHETSLRYYRSAARRIGLAAEIDRTLGELDRDGHDVAQLPDKLREAAAARASSEPLSAVLDDKLHDLALIYRTFGEFVAGHGFDPQLRLRQVFDALAQTGEIHRTRVYVDGFVDLSAAERQLCLALARDVDHLCFTLPIDPAALQDRGGLADCYSRPLRTLRRLQSALSEARIAQDPPLHLGQPRRFSNVAIESIERHWCSGRPAPGDDHSCVTFVESPTRRDEVVAAARTIRRWVSERGLRYRDIAVLMRDAATYEAVIAAVFVEHALPYFFDQRRPARHHPLLQLVRGVIRIGRIGFTSEAMLAIARSGLAGVSDDDTDRLEEFIRERRIASARWTAAEPWQYRGRRGTDAEEHAEKLPSVDWEPIDTLRRRLTAPLLQVARGWAESQPRRAHDLLALLVDLLENLGVAEIMSGWTSVAATAGNATTDHQQVWSQFSELLTQFDLLLGDEEMTPSDFLAALEFGLDRFDYALVPPTLDQIIVSDVDRVRTPPLRACVVMGLNDGEFPRAATEGAILGDEELTQLNALGVDTHPGTTQQLLDEAFLGYIALTRASEHLLLTRAAYSPSGRATVPSPYWRRVQSILPDCRIVCGFDGPLTPGEVVERVGAWVRDSKRDFDSVDAALYELLRDVDDPELAARRRRAWSWLDRERPRNLPRHLARRLYPMPMTSSVSRLESYARCPYQHFATYGLRLEVAPETEIGAREIGVMSHAAMERLVRDIITHQLDWPDPAGPGAQSVDELVNAVAAELAHEFAMNDGRGKYALHRLRRMIADTVRSQRNVASIGSMRPRGVEMTFGPDADLEPLMLTTAAGPVALRGKIDRLDFLADVRRFAVLDYKLSADPLDRSMLFHGAAVQLLTYLLVVKHSTKLRRSGVAPKPLAGLLVPIGRSIKTVAHPDDAAVTELELSKMRGLVTSSGLAAFDASEPAKPRPLTAALGKSGPRYDAIHDEDLDALLEWVHGKLSDLANEIVEGGIAVAPFFRDGKTPCPRCDFAAVCRFEPADGGYVIVPPVDQAALLQVIGQSRGDADAE